MYFWLNFSIFHIFSILLGILSHFFLSEAIFKLYRKEFVQQKMSLNNREFLSGKREEGCESAGQQADIFKVRLGLGEMERHRNKYT
jgi:hypothetical protein